MKIIFIISLLLRSIANAQVNLDAPIPVGPADLVYKSAADVNGAYLFPTRLVSLNQPRIEEIDGEYRAFFDVGMDPSQFDPISAKVIAMLDPNGAPLTLRMMRGWNASITIGESFEIEKKFKARLVPLGDPGVVGNPLPYMLVIKKIGPKLGKESQAVLQNIFKSQYSKHLGEIRYEFNAIMGGAPYISATTVNIFAVNREPVVQANFVEKLKFGDNVYFDTMTAPDLQPNIALDSEASCWDKPAVGQICLRAQ